MLDIEYSVIMSDVIKSFDCIEIKRAHSPKTFGQRISDDLFSDRTDFSEPLHLKDTLQLLCKCVRRINLHISVRKYRGICLF